MTKETARQLINVIEQGLCEKQHGIAKHWELVKKFADGANIQVETYNGWVDVEDPDFQEACHYRMKPELPKRWRAERGGKYFSICECFGRFVPVKTIDTSNADDEIYNSANYFETKKDAQLVADCINKIFKLIREGVPVSDIKFK